MNSHMIWRRRLAALAWSLKQGMREIGLPGVTAFVLLVVCAGAYVLVLRPLKTEILDIREQWGAVSSLKQGPAPSGSPMDGLNGFYASVPGADTQFSLMERLHRAAAAQSLALDHGDYQLVAEAATPLVRYEIELPVKGDYAQIRRFIAASMRDLPTLALKSVSFTRQKSDDPVLNAKISFVLYLKKEDA
jgi:hypothetical protein